MEQFYQLKTHSKISTSLLQFAKDDSTVWIHRNAFDIALVPFEKLDELLLNFQTKYKIKPVIFKMHPWQFYRFHTDASRSCAINLLLEGIDSHTYYGTETVDEEIYQIKELIYTIDNYYLLNTQLKHSVINRNNVRYMFSMGFDDGVTYIQIRKFCQENNL